MAKQSGAVRPPSGSGSYERPKRKAGEILKRLWKYLYQYKWLLLLAVVLSIGANMLALIGPKLSGNVIDAIGIEAGKVDFDTVFYYAKLMIIFYIASSVLSFALSNLMIRISRKVVYSMRKDVFDRLTAMPVRFFDEHRTGDVISVICYDIDTINASLSTDLVTVLSSIITEIGALAMMVSISPLLVLVFVVTIPASIMFTKYRSTRVRPMYRKRSEKLGALNGFIEEMTGGLKSIKAYNREKVILSRFEKKNDDAVEANYTADHFSCMTGPMVNFINNTSLALISIFGALMYMNKIITTGDIGSFVLYSRKFSGPINEFANIISDLQSALAAAERVLNLIDAPTEPADAENAEALYDVKGNVRLENVDFGYEELKRILHGIDFEAEQGQTIALVGPTGCGKTTIINLLMRFYDVDGGSINVDGKDVRNVTRDSLRRTYTMVLQDTWLFNGTIFDNIAYGKENVTRPEVERAARAAKIHSFIMSLPKGYDTMLNDNGVNISKGQKQLLTIARAMLVDSPMLILDEATSNVDTQTERQIQSAMLSLMKGRTCFVIAHRLSTIRHADCILVMNGGKIIEQGTHEKLMAKRGAYYAMYHAQFETA